MEEFSQGEVVRLKSGGPAMTLQWYEDDYRMWVCSWFDNHGEHHQERFAPASLEKVGSQAQSGRPEAVRTAREKDNDFA